ncbi:hypothetical protein AFI02nite_14170 [Aliivibrio fischeri]|uniref:Uncharacterized protein n=1 Tax=Aliivibrio fischeri TaxID=668 RepID=A0A510UJ57_ALIFS|nr:hypothetical protein AFI02nite_14170 [Aliivibrio fischeri]
MHTVKRLKIISREVELSESISGRRPPMVPKNQSHNAVSRSIWLAESSAAEAAPDVNAATFKCVLKFAIGFLRILL